MAHSVHDEYTLRRDRFAAESARLDRVEGRIAAVRGVTFVIGLGLAIAWMSQGSPSPAWILLPLVVFVAAVAFHRRILQKRRRVERGVRLYERALQRLAGRWADFGAEGERYRDATHPYADDFDLFGPGSLFQRLWRGATRLGEDRLANWLLTPAERETVIARQNSVKELQDRHDLRETIGLLESNGEEGNQNLLRAWAGVPSRPISPAVRWLAVGLSIAFWSGLAAWLFDAAGVSWAVASYAGCLVLTFVLRRRITEAVGRLNRAEAGLSALADVLEIAEQEDFASPMLEGVRRRLATEGLPCSARVAELHKLSHRFDSALFNQFFAPIALGLNLPIHLAHAAEIWRERFGSAVPLWLDAVGDFEALLSLAGYAAEHPLDAWPEIATGAPRFIARRLGHPLLPDDRCVRNDVSLGEPTRLLVVSGSNMAGKSTLLRTTGINAVLAFAGGPVRADALTLTPLSIGSVIRVSDSLQSGKSFFFAAIERLKQVAALAGGTPPLFFLLDELLAGTNSHDRAIGAEAIVRRLLDDASLGIVTTHDLALTEMADSLGPVAENVHFRDLLVGDTLQFDYTLRPGVVDRGNALALMRLVGLMPHEEPASPDLATGRQSLSAE